MQMSEKKKITILTIFIFLIAVIILLLVNQKELEEGNLAKEGNLENASENINVEEKDIANDKEDADSLDNLASIIEAVEVDTNLDIKNIGESYAEVLNEINSPSKLVAFLNQSFTFNSDSQDLLAKSPEDFLKDKEGSSYDYAHFSARVLDDLGLVVGVLRYDFVADQEDKSSVLVVFRQDNQPAYISFSESEVLLFNYYGSSFRDLLRAEETRLDMEVSRYAYFPSDVDDFSKPVDSFEWIDF
jgi:hypothetical protein